MTFLMAFAGNAGIRSLRSVMVLEAIAGEPAAESAPGIAVPPALLIGGAVLIVVLVIALTAALIWRRRTPKEQIKQEKPAVPAQVMPTDGSLSRTIQVDMDLKEDPVVVADARIAASVRIGKLHEQGAREYQQDCFAVSDLALLKTHGLLAVVADGMGGLSDGDKVSALAVNTILDNFTRTRGRGTPQQTLPILAGQAVRAINEFLTPDNYRKCGSTLVMGILKFGSFSFLSIGDSRVYLMRNGILTQLNREHIYLNDLLLQVINGEKSMKDAYEDGQAGGLTSFLGMGEISHVDMPAEPMAAIPGDTFALMSDGVYNAISEAEILEALLLEPEAAAEAMREAIRKKGYSNQDNYTCVIMKYCDPVLPETENDGRIRSLSHTDIPE